MVSSTRIHETTETTNFFFYRQCQQIKVSLYKKRITKLYSSGFIIAITWFDNFQWAMLQKKTWFVYVCNI